MAFVLSAALSPSSHKVPSSSSCSRQPGILKTLAPPAAFLIISAGLISPLHIAAEDAPLVFDHDQTLSGANFENRSDLRGAIFSKANCKNASFAGSDLTNAQLDDANVRYF